MWIQPRRHIEQKNHGFCKNLGPAGTRTEAVCATTCDYAPRLPRLNSRAFSQLVKNNRSAPREAVDGAGCVRKVVGLYPWRNRALLCRHVPTWLSELRYPSWQCWCLDGARFSPWFPLELCFSVSSDSVFTLHIVSELEKPNSWEGRKKNVDLTMSACISTAGNTDETGFYRKKISVNNTSL